MKYMLITILVLVLAAMFSAAQMQPGSTQNQGSSMPAGQSSSMPQDQTSAMSRDQGSTGSTAQDEIRKIEDEWFKAGLNKDRAALDRIEADDYVFVMPDGKIRNKRQDMDSLSGLNFTSFTNSDMDIRVYGDTAEVIGVAHIKGMDNGQDMTGDYRYTDVFVKRNGEWKAVSTEATKIVPSTQR